MIDPFSEQLVTLAEAAGLLPRRRRGRKPAVQTLYRWASHGVRGVCLETIQIGGTRCTSREALQRFFAALQTNPTPPTAQAPALTDTAISQQLDVAGF